MVKEKKISLRKAAAHYGIPKDTINRRAKGIIPKKIGGQTLLTNLEEKTLVEGIVKASEWGFPFTKYELQLLCKGYFDQQGRVISRLKNNMPGYDWASSFLKRHDRELSIRLAENIKRNIAVTHAICK